ncbi:hypothetical protein JZ751_016472 [Albula glossodonta]|uniref:LIM zinc-binding domain-containing protein n=1 Tax=Albula glossodonta TaxID=121402 RepID=A0A8T2NTF5_9TELE|nr:hypothetical protein JZ751_016472 [Albula glossodonta]
MEGCENERGGGMGRKQEGFEGEGVYERLPLMLSSSPLYVLKIHGEKKRSLGQDYHQLCLKCQQCKRQLTPGQHAEVTEDQCRIPVTVPLLSKVT